MIARSMRLGLLAACLAGMAAACGAAPGDAPAPQVRDDAPAAVSPPPATAEEEVSVGIEPGLERIVGLAVGDLSARLGVGAEEVAVVSAELVVWPDASLGCPQPDMRYAQVPQDGARIALEAGGRPYRYHTGGNRTEPFLCEQAPAKRPPITPLEPRLGPSPGTRT